MKNVKVKFADQTNTIQVQAADDIDEVLSNLEFDPCYDPRLGNELYSLEDLVNIYADSATPDIITGMNVLTYDDNENGISWIFSIGKEDDIDKSELDEAGYEYHYFKVDNTIYVYYSLCEEIF